MPKATIWIRTEDWNKWQAIEDKPRFVHDSIAMYEKEIIVAPKEALNDDGSLKSIYETNDPERIVQRIRIREFCKHGAAIGLCKYGCKK